MIVKKRITALVSAKRKLTTQKKKKIEGSVKIIPAETIFSLQTGMQENRKNELVITKQTRESQYTRSLIEASLDPLVTISGEGKILDVNEASVKVTGTPRTTLIGTNFSNYFTNPEKAQKGYMEAFEKGFVSDYALTIKHVNGKLTDVLYNASVYKDDNGKVLGVFAAARDVTEQKWAKDLRIANQELVFQNKEKENRAAELIIANQELVFQNKEKESRAAELIIANQELAFQNNEKEKRAAEVIIANQELVFQNKEKEKRAAELIVANQELAFQNKEKEKRAAELNIANQELAFQNKEKEKRAAELIIANQELVFQNKEKESRSAELLIANKELVYQNEEKEKRAAELIIANKELVAFTYISSHDLQEPMRKIQTFAGRLLETEHQNLTDTGKEYFQRMQAAAKRMQQLLKDLLAFSRVNSGELKFEIIDLKSLIKEVKTDFKETIEATNATFELDQLGQASIIPVQFRQLIQNLIGNALKFSVPGKPPHIVIQSKISNGSKLLYENNILTTISSEKNYCHIKFSDNGIGFEPEFKEQIFEVFQRLHSKAEYEGTGIGLAIVKKIIENHKGIITATSELGKGATFDIYLPN